MKKTGSETSHHMKTKFLSLILFSILLCHPAIAGEIHDLATSGDLQKLKALLKANPNLIASNPSKQV